jgi:hypothetical protein
MHGSHIVNHICKPHLREDSTLHVIGVCSNPVRYHSRYRIAREWIKHMFETPNVQLHIVETAFGDRHHELELPPGVNVLHLRTHSELWIKEAMINLAVRHLLPKDWKYVAWIDMDVFFRDPHWALETIHQLQHFQIVQPWQTCADLGPQGGSFQDFRSFGFQHQRRVPKQKWPAQPYPYAHSGFAWACTRKFWENIVQFGGLIWWAILGSADHHMAFACIGEVQDTVHGKMSAGFKRRAQEWQQAVMRVTHGEVGFTPGRIEHMFHGPKKRRYYRERWQLLIDHGFCPDKDLVLDSQGLPILCGKPRLEQAIRMYNRSRFEDSIEEV